MLWGPVAAAARAAGLLVAHGLPPPAVTGGGTGTFPYEIEGGVHTEVRVGCDATLPTRPPPAGSRSVVTVTPPSRPRPVESKLKTAA